MRRRATYVADPTTRAYRHPTPEERGERDRLEFKSLAAEALEQLTAAAIGYARRVEEALRPTLTGLDLPLILAASEPLDSIFRSVSTYAHLARPVIPGDGPAAAILRYPV